ncbi:TonB-dependent receptor [Pseudoalteromonas luteoviolacea]|uniref:TonB-dependent receptor domain-containing protein n=1 Tax=Pseudoalteromonas luteoviolacea TaxID=43657 RepID=UPI0031B9F582|nr:TonB-dependent receptor [Pseudoalteromonas luteoviolacea]
MSSSKKINNALYISILVTLCIFNTSKGDAAPIAKQRDKQEVQSIERITVTGSHIAQGTSTHLLTRVSNDIFDQSAYASLSDILIDEVVQINEGISNVNSQNSTHNSGLSTVDLRGLGLNRTLTLIDGRRVVSNSYSGELVSLSSIPKGMIKNIEIITGGASAAYGSGAISGVVNIITKQSKDDTTINLTVGESVAGGAREIAFNADTGFQYTNQQGQLLLSATYIKHFGLDYWDRDRAQQQDDWRYDPKRMCNTMLTALYQPKQQSAYRCMRDIDQSDWTSLSDALPGGVFNESSSFKPNSGFWFDEQTLRNDWQEEVHGLHFNQYNLLQLPSQQLNLAIKNEFDFKSGEQAYFQLHYSKNDSQNIKSPENEDECDLVITYNAYTQQFGSDCIGAIPYTNPYIPAKIRESANNQDIKWDRLFQEVGAVTNDNSRTTLRTWAGLNGIMWDNWQWDASLGFGQFIQQQTRYNELNVAHVRNALNARKLPDGSIECIDEDARKAGCTPINLFGENAISPAAASYIRANPKLTTRLSQITLSAALSGELINLPSGPVLSAFGIDYRRDSQNVSTNVPQGGVTFNYIPNFSGDVTSYEIFMEASVPLLKDKRFAHQLSLSLAARAADYSWSNMGLIQSYNLGFNYTPTTHYAVKFNWAKAMRAPTITELMSPIRGDYNAFQDLCDGVTATSTLMGHDNCRKEASINATIKKEGIFHDRNNSYSPNLGNPELTEETADSFAVELQVEPQSIANMTINASYYRISIRDVITSLSHQNIMNRCYQTDTPFDPNNPFCQAIKRDSEGQIIELQQRLVNANQLFTQGYDAAIHYTHTLNRLGQLRFKLNWNHVIEHALISDHINGRVTEIHEGYLNHHIFADTGKASLSWQHDKWQVSWHTQFKSGITRNKQVYENWLGFLKDNSEQCTQLSDTCIDNPEPLWGNDLPSYTTHSLQFSYRQKLQGSTLRLSGNVKNLFNNNGPFIIGGNGNFHSAYGGGRGRFVSLGAQITF